MSTLAIPTPTRIKAQPLPSLRFALRLDAVVSGANGVAYLALAGPLADLLGMPAGFLRGLGAFFLVFAPVVWLVSTRELPGQAAVKVIALGNLGWVAASIAFAVAGWHDPSAAGTAWILAQAAAVALFAELQLLSLREVRRS